MRNVLNLYIQVFTSIGEMLGFSSEFTEDLFHYLKITAIVTSCFILVWSMLMAAFCFFLVLVG